MIPIPKSLLISLLAFCLLLPLAVEAHHAIPWVAGLIMPTVAISSYLGWSCSYVMFGISDAVLFTAVPGLGHIYACDFWGFFKSIGLWALGYGSTFLAYTSGIIPLATLSGLSLIGSYIYSTLHAPIAAKRHNEKHAKDKAESSRITVYPTLALGKEYVGIGVGVGF